MRRRGHPLAPATHSLGSAGAGGLLLSVASLRPRVEFGDWGKKYAHRKRPPGLRVFSFPPPAASPAPSRQPLRLGPPSLPCLRVVGAAVMWQEGHQARPDEHGAAPERRPRDGRKVPLWLSSLDALLGGWRSLGRDCALGLLQPSLSAGVL